MVVGINKILLTKGLYYSREQKEALKKTVLLVKLVMLVLRKLDRLHFSFMEE